MRTQDRLRYTAAVATLAVAGALLPALTLATHQPTVADIVSEATSSTWNMSCDGSPDRVDCTAADFDLTWFENATILPGSGNVTALDTNVTANSARASWLLLNLGDQKSACVRWPTRRGTLTSSDAKTSTADKA
jgi:hypothetical protein